MLTTALSSSTPTWVSAKADSSFEHRYISTSIIPVRSIGLSLPGLTIDAHEVLMMFGRSCDVNVLNLWVLFSLDWFEQQPWPPPPQVQVLTEQSLDRVVVGDLPEPEPGGLRPKPPWPPPQSNMTWFQLSVGFVLSCSLHQSTVPLLHCVCCQECWKLGLEFLQSAVQVAELNSFKLTCSWLRLHMFQVFPGQLLGIDKWGLIIRPALILQRLFLVDGVHVLVAVTLAGTGATLWTFPVVVWLSI
jgi:hypothetical protein